ncbi:CPBP family intramembrane metalloprotease [candidate division WWE3 bacterium]|uniref:CPBP family intramembrane metalloprotease n=1 Tax=candidate division WWE3 bacterium TaxID=2053526 RepID=A0A928TTB6_UNCKA|nr:CPBP family intramembrane metalloprotease [candidate division WWE3 bacterium]
MKACFPIFIWKSYISCNFSRWSFLSRLHSARHQTAFRVLRDFVMVIPYCMIHFGKPMPETFAAIIAGVVLGFLSLKSKSIWLGVMIHCSVALTMDLCALYRKGLL